MKRLGTLIVFGTLATACAEDSTDPLDPVTDAVSDSGRQLDDGGLTPDSTVVVEDLAITSITPSGGPEEGSTTVVISGSGFKEGAIVAFGGLAGTGTAVNSSRSMRSTAPAGAGVVTVTVTNPGGEEVSLTNAYTYRIAVPEAVDWCAVQFPATLVVAPGMETGPVFGRVYEESCTEGEASCGRIQAELGYGGVDTDPEGWTWAAAASNPAHTEDDNDEFRATLTVGLPGEYDYAYRMRINEGAWTYCDLDGTDNGFQVEQTGRLSVQEGVQTLGWCALHHPNTLNTQPGIETEAVYGRFLMDGCTNGADACGAIQAELGWGDPLVDPSATPDAWQWQLAGYNPDHTADDNDEHSLTLTPPAAGVFAYTYRVTVDGDSWTYCDLDGTENGFQLDQTGQLTVVEDAVEIGWCTLQFPESIAVPVGQGATVYGRAFVAGCTDGDAQCPVLQGQLGYGQGDDPEAFQWVGSVYSPDHTDDDNDEHLAVVVGLDAGQYRYAYRFSVDGENWTLCDLDSSENGFAPEQMGRLEVGEPELELSWCQLHFPDEITLNEGAELPTIYARAFVEGCTDGANACGVLTGQLGIAPVGGQPQWFDAEYNPAHTMDDNDEWQWVAPTPAIGDYRYWYRFSIDAGANWMECGLDGAVFAPEQAGMLTVDAVVVEPAPTIGWCQVQFPQATRTVPGIATDSIYGQVYVEGCTDGDARCDVMAQVGFGPANTLPSADWQWTAADYNAGHVADDNDEYAAIVLAPEAGVYGYGYRFSSDEGASWTYCDRTGDDGELTLEEVPVLTVSTREIGWCNIQAPHQLEAVLAEAAVYGRAYVEGCTEMADRCWGLRMQTGFGAMGTDPQEDAWRWFEGTYNGGHVADNNDEFSSTVEILDADWRYVTRFSGDNGASWTYCDTDGGEFSVEAAGTVVRPVP